VHKVVKIKYEINEKFVEYLDDKFSLLCK